MNMFDQIKVPVPFAVTDLEATIKAIEERRAYYSNPPQEDLKAPTEETPEEDKKVKQHPYMIGNQTEEKQ